MARRRNRNRRSRGKKKRRTTTESVERNDHLELQGVVDQVYAGGNFEVALDGGTSVKARLCGRMRRYRIRVLLGDRVTVALSPYDLTHGLITFRFKESQPRAA